MNQNSKVMHQTAKQWAETHYKTLWSWEEPQIQLIILCMFITTSDLLHIFIWLLQLLCVSNVVLPTCDTHLHSDEVLWGSPAHQKHPSQPASSALTSLHSEPTHPQRMPSPLPSTQSSLALNITTHTSECCLLILAQHSVQTPPWNRCSECAEGNLTQQSSHGKFLLTFTEEQQKASCLETLQIGMVCARPWTGGLWIGDISEVRCLHRAWRILKDNAHPSHSLFTLLPSGKQYPLSYHQTPEQLLSTGCEAK